MVRSRWHYHHFWHRAIAADCYRVSGTGQAQWDVMAKTLHSQVAQIERWHNLPDVAFEFESAMQIQVQS